MRTPGYQPIELLPPTGRRVGGEPALDATDRPAVPQDPVLRQPTDDGIIGAIRGDVQSQAGAAAHGQNGAWREWHEVKSGCTSKLASKAVYKALEIYCTKSLSWCHSNLTEDFAYGAGSQTSER